jgi:phosphatidylcholine synthase
LGVGSWTLIGAWLVHAYTASGIVFAFLAARAFIEFDYRTGFFWLWLQVFVDATDGLLARRLRVRERIPWFDGGKLDDLSDFLTYVFVPALFVWRGALVANAWALPVAMAMLLSSGYGFSRTDAKTSDHFFTGFPSYWNVVVFYLLVVRWPAAVNAAILVFFAVMVFVPIRYVYPSRTPVSRVAMNVSGAIWAGLMLLMLWQYPAVAAPVFWISLAYPAYYFFVSFWLHFSGFPRKLDTM